MLPLRALSSVLNAPGYCAEVRRKEEMATITIIITRSELLKEINKLTERLSKARELLLNGDIDGGDYKIIKTESEQKIDVLEAKLAEVAGNKKQAERIEPLLDQAIPKLTQLESIYCKSETYEKRELIGSMYPQKFTFEELQHRTAQTSELYTCIYLINNELSEKKEGKRPISRACPFWLPRLDSNPLVNRPKALNPVGKSSKCPLYGLNLIACCRI
jgi:hypothetical protein